MVKCTIMGWRLILCLLLPFTGFAQDIGAWMGEAGHLRAAFKDQEALELYLKVLQYQPNQLDALCKASELYSILGKRQASKDKQHEFYLKGRQLAARALQVNANSADANFVMAMAMGRMAQMASGEERIKAVRDIRNYALKCIQLDPHNFKGYHLLAKWHYEVSNLNSLEKWLVKIAYGALPEASLEEAIRNYEISRQLNPGFLLNYLELAKAYHRKGDDKKAIALLRTMQQLPNTISDDPVIKKEGSALLKEWSR